MTAVERERKEKREGETEEEEKRKRWKDAAPGGSLWSCLIIVMTHLTQPSDIGIVRQPYDNVSDQSENDVPNKKT